MRLTRFTDYSIRVLIYLGQNNESRVTIQQISDVYGISKNHLMKVVSNLTRLKLVAAQRGPGGGIQLNCEPEEIKLSEVIKNTEKHLSTKKPMKETETVDLTADTRVQGFLRVRLTRPCLSTETDSCIVCNWPLNSVICLAKTFTFSLNAW